MMSVMKGWSSIRIPADARGQGSAVGGSGFTGDKVGMGAGSWMWLGGLPQVPVSWSQGGNPKSSLTQWGDRGSGRCTEPPTPSPCTSPTPFLMYLLGGNFISLTKIARIPK